MSATWRSFFTRQTTAGAVASRSVTAFPDRKLLLACTVVTGATGGGFYNSWGRGMQPIKVRAEVADDYRAIDVVNLSAFEGEAEAQLVDELRNSDGFIPDLSLVAELNGRVVGHVVLSKVKLKLGQESSEILALGPMSVVPSQSHRGIGSELIEAAIARARPHVLYRDCCGRLPGVLPALRFPAGQELGFAL